MFGALLALILTVLGALFAALAWPIRRAIAWMKGEEPEDSDSSDDAGDSEDSGTSGDSGDSGDSVEVEGSESEENVDAETSSAEKSQ